MAHLAHITAVDLFVLRRFTYTVLIPAERGR
jgi:hypothetical protein